MRRHALRPWALAALVLTLVVGLSGCSPTGSSKIHISALMADSSGLFVGNEVGILGVPVGKVTSITPEGKVVRVKMAIDADQPVPANAGAVVVARSVATDRYVELTPVFHRGPRMKDGAVIQLPRTRTPVDFDTVLGTLNLFATGLSGTPGSRNAIRDVIGAGAKTLDGQGNTINGSITALAAAVNGVASNRGDITGTMKSLDRLTTVLANNQGLVREFVTQVSSASSMLADERENFRQALDALRTAVQLVAEFSKKNRPELVKTLNESSALMESLMTKRDNVKEILQVMPVALENLGAIYHDGAVRVRLDPLVLTPLGGIVDTICKNASLTPICNVVGPGILNLQYVLKELSALGGSR